MSASPPPFEYPNLVGIVPEQAELAIRVAYENIDYLRQLLRTPSQLTTEQIQQITNQAIAPGPPGPAGPPGPPGPAAGVLVGPHTIRISSFPATGQPTGQLYYETDRNAMYVVSKQSGLNTWVYVDGLMTGAYAQRPVDLGPNDRGFVFYANGDSPAYNHVWRWGGSAWSVLFGLMEGTRFPDQRPAGLGTAGIEFRFLATDQGISYEWNGAAWLSHTELSFALLDTHANRTSSGTVDTTNVAHSVVTWDTGQKFDPSWVGHPILVNGIVYTVLAYTDSTHITISGNAGGNSGVNYSFSAYPAAQYHLGSEFSESDRLARYIAVAATGTLDINAGGTVTTNGTAVTWVSGDKFNVLWSGTVTINAVNYTIASVNSPTSITLTGSAGVQATPVVYSTAQTGSLLTNDSGDAFDPYWVGYYIVISGASYLISAYLDATHLQVTTTSTVQSAATFSITPGKWIYESGIMQGTLNPDHRPADLGTNDTNFLFNSTDFDRIYQWTGSAWVDAPGQEARSVQMFTTAPPTLGWHLCNGATNVRTSKPDGTTALITVPAMNGGTFPRGNAAYSGPTPTAAVAPGISGNTADDPTGASVTVGTSSIATGDGTSGSATVVTSVTFNEGIHHHGVGSLAVDATGKPQLMDFLFYIRL